jgi:DMSO/TMAO reductase YedYZ molybdopterin-dependent catalytic subunit
MRASLRGAASGVVAAVAGVSTGNLLAAATTPSAAPVELVGTQVIDWTPTPAKEWAIATFGAADKPILIASVAIGALAIAALAGTLAQRRWPAGIAVLAGLGAIAATIALTRPNAAPLDAAPSVLAGLVTTGILTLLLRTPRATPDGGPSRRLVLTQVGLLAVAAAVQGTASLVTRRRTRPADLALPRATDVPPPLRRGLDVKGITPFRTSSRDFYRVDTRLTLPIVDVDSWRLRIDGDVRRPVSLAFDDLTRMRLIERDITLTCVSNEVGGRYVGGARWLGVPLADVLDRAGFDASSADQILSTDVDGMTISTPLSIATDGRDSMIAIGMNGAPLPREHGFPARLIVPGIYGFVGATKWITRMTLTTYAAQDAYWTKRGWATDAPIKPSSRIDTPRPFQDIRTGSVVIGGIAWAQQQGGIAAVEVSIDDGPWRPATLGPSAGQDYWRQWYLRWDATAGPHSLAARATTGRGQSQTARRAAPFPDGSSGIQRLTVNVT